MSLHSDNSINNDGNSGTHANTDFDRDTLTNLPAKACVFF